MLHQGASLKDVQDTLGHAQVALTANLYGHLYEERRQEIADRMDAHLGGQIGGQGLRAAEQRDKVCA